MYGVTVTKTSCVLIESSDRMFGAVVKRAAFVGKGCDNGFKRCERYRLSGRTTESRKTSFANRPLVSEYSTRIGIDNRAF
jgi:hypothetical protein